ncbi:MAG: hypothetical protein EP325_16555 [Vibrionaceae bacterium]|nr:MAG: hypothetical protein EP325_16555 [Vibrionaceae bacterium]
MRFKISLIVLTLTLCGCVTKPAGETYNPKHIEIDSENSLVIIFLEDDNKGVFGRENRFSWIVTDGQRELATISNGTYFTYQTKPGVIELNAALLKGDLYLPIDVVDVILDGITAIQNIDNNKNLKYEFLHKMTVEKGQIYYLKWNVTFPKKIVWGGPDPIVTLEQVSKETGEIGLSGLSKALTSGKYK